MRNERRLLGVVKIAVTEGANWSPPGLTASGRVEVTCAQVTDGVAESDLLGWAFDALSGMIDVDPPPVAQVIASAAAFDWPSVFKTGDVVRSQDERTIGVVLLVADSGGDSVDPRYELHVDAATDGVPEGACIWDPWEARVANDPASLDEARRLGLRGA